MCDRCRCPETVAEWKPVTDEVARRVPAFVQYNGGGIWVVEVATRSAAHYAWLGFVPDPENPDYTAWLDPRELTLAEWQADPSNPRVWAVGYAYRDDVDEYQALVSDPYAVEAADARDDLSMAEAMVACARHLLTMPTETEL
jgi:hypothetical protein